MMRWLVENIIDNRQIRQYAFLALTFGGIAGIAYFGLWFIIVVFAMQILYICWVMHAQGSFRSIETVVQMRKQAKKKETK